MSGSESGSDPPAEEARTGERERGLEDGDGGEKESESDGTAEGPRVGASGQREVVVPMRLYKTITVFSTLLAVVAILGGFIVLDVATDRAQAAASDVSIGLALLGVALIACGAGAYAFSTRFRTAGMGNAKDDADEGSHNG
nr:hypothetical protein [Natronosalvus caseinilyticus]